MEERMITVVIPTYNRFDCMKYFFENCFLTYTGKLFTFEIHDSSEDDRVKEYIDANIGDSPILKYFKYDPSINGDVKAMRAVLNVQTEYVYLMGDGAVFDFNEWENLLLESCFYNYLVIGLEWSTGKQKGEKTICSDPGEIFDNFFGTLIFFGVTIVKKTLLDSVEEKIVQYEKRESPFTFVCSILEGLAVVHGTSVFFPFKTLHSVKNPYKKMSGWNARGDVLRVWCYELYESLALLPDCYYVEHIYKNAENFFTSFIKLLRWRALKSLTWKKIKKYKKYILAVAGKKALFRMSLTLLFPSSILKLFYEWIYKRHHRKEKMGEHYI